MNKEKIDDFKRIVHNIDRLKNEIRYLERYIIIGNDYQRFIFPIKKKKFTIFHKGERFVEIDLTFEEIQYLLGLKEQELRNLEKELDEL